MTNTTSPSVPSAPPEGDSDPLVAGAPAPFCPPVTGESDRAYEAFCAYFRLGPRRRYAAVAREFGVSLRTVKRWAGAFDWRGRIRAYAAGSAGRFLAAEVAVERAEVVDAAQRVRSLRERQFDLVEALLDAAERYLERVDEDDLDQMEFTDACKALEVAARLGQAAAPRDRAEDPNSAEGLRNQLTSLLDQAYGNSKSTTAETSSQP